MGVAVDGWWQRGASEWDRWSIVSQGLDHGGGLCGEDCLQGLVENGALVVCVRSGAAQAVLHGIGFGK